jgi:putative tryptophan/tyrosine transport system substrate-binding protein
VANPPTCAKAEHASLSKNSVVNLPAPSRSRVVSEQFRLALETRLNNVIDVEQRRPRHEWDAAADRGDASCCRRMPARRTDLAQGAEGCRDIACRLAGVCGPGPRRPNFDVFRARLAEQGYVEGKNLIIEQRFADCRYDRMPGLAADLARVPVDVLFTMGTRASRIVAETVKTTPLVVYSCDPFEHVTRLARGRGNLTGVTCMTTELSPKRLELLHDAVPKASRVMFLHDPQAAPNAWKLTQEAAPRLGITLQQAQVGAADDLLPELTMIAKERPDALFVYPDVVPSSYPRPQQLAEFAIKAQLPMMNAFRFFADAGGLMSYGATTSEIYTSAAEQVAKILRGTPPSELPLREATRFELVINNWTARALGLTILVRADEVIESAPPFATISPLMARSVTAVMSAIAPLVGDKQTTATVETALMT